MSVARVRATESRTFGTESQLRSRKCGKTSRANNSSDKICFVTSWEQSSAKVWRWFHRLLWANHSANSASRPRSKTGSVDTCFTSSVTWNVCNIQNLQYSLANSDVYFKPCHKGVFSVRQFKNRRFLEQPSYCQLMKEVSNAPKCGTDIFKECIRCQYLLPLCYQCSARKIMYSIPKIN